MRRKSLEIYKRNYLILTLVSIFLSLPLAVTEGLDYFIRALIIIIVGVLFEYLVRKIFNNSKSYAPIWVLILIPVILPKELPIYTIIITIIFTSVITSVFVNGGSRPIISLLPVIWIFARLSFPDYFLTETTYNYPIIVITFSILLIVLKVIDFKIVISSVTTVLVLFLFTNNFSTFLLGNLLIGFLIVLPIISESGNSNEGRIISGIIAGILLYVINTFSSNRDGTMFAILITQIFSPLVDDIVLNIRGRLGAIDA